MKIGILTAMKKEYDQIAMLLNEKKMVDGRVPHLTGRLNGHDIVLQQCGIGKVNAAVYTSELIRDYAPSCIVSTGVAGGIDPSLHVMDVIVSDRLVHHDFFIGMGLAQGEIEGLPRFFPAAPSFVEAARALGDPSVHIGLICTGDQFVSSPADLTVIKGNFPDGLAVDMESAAIAQTCYLYEVPFVSFRIISDTPGVDNHVDQYQDFWGEMTNRSFQVTRRFLESL